MKKIFSVLIACLALSTQALGSTDTQKATRTGVDDHGRNCLFSYQITKEAPSSVSHHRDIVYKILLENLGSCDLRDVVVVDHLSRRVQFLDATPGYILRDDKVIWKDVRIEENRKAFFFIKVEPRTEHEVELVDNTASAFAREVGQKISATVSTTVFRR